MPNGNLAETDWPHRRDWRWPVSLDATALAELGSDIVHLWMSTGAELVALGHDRSHKMMQAAGAVMRASDLNDLLDLQANYAEEMVRDYAAAAARAIELWDRAATHRWVDQGTPLAKAGASP